MKRLVVFCDGTWNDTRMASLTNVARLAKCVEPVDDRDNENDPHAPVIPQVVFYDSGVGVSANVSRFVDFLIRLEGGAFGRGLDEKIEAAYRFLVLNYDPGDELYIFGFSRGAYTARSLGGLVRKCGILKRDCFDMIPEAIRLYRDRDIQPQKVSQFRRAYAHHPDGSEHPIATGAEDLPDNEKAVWEGRYPRPTPLSDTHRIADDGADPDGPETDGRIRPSKDHLARHRVLNEAGPSDRAIPTPRHDQIYKMMFLGLWDTVGALGVPTRFPVLAGLFNRRYRFHDTDASSLLTSIRHAVAVNEDRRVFDVAPVSNIEKLNLQWARALGLAWPVPHEALPYQQRWFPGDHGAVGGGNPEPGLSSAALLWVAEGAQIEGLYLKEKALNELSEARRLQNPLANWRIEKNGVRKAAWVFDLLGFIGGYRDRRGPLTLLEVHESTIERLESKDANYRPPPLQRFTGAVNGTPLYRILAFWLYPVVLIALAAVVVFVLALLAATLTFGLAEAWPTVCGWASDTWRWIAGRRLCC